ncbi:MAG: hypothetical protein Fur0010_04260 [Bdellovibrio sp.]
MNQTAGSYFINGKNQVIEMLKLMTNSEKKMLLSNIRKRNPTLANELEQKSISFDAVFNLTRGQYEYFFKAIKPTVLGIALKDSSIDKQRQLLSISPRKYAEEAFTIMTTLLENERQAIPKAQEKIVEILTDLMSKKVFREL